MPSSGTGALPRRPSRRGYGPDALRLHAAAVPQEVQPDVDHSHPYRPVHPPSGGGWPPPDRSRSSRRLRGLRPLVGELGQPATQLGDAARTTASRPVTSATWTSCPVRRAASSAALPQGGSGRRSCAGPPALKPPRRPPGSGRRSSSLGSPAGPRPRGAGPALLGASAATPPRWTRSRRSTCSRWRASAVAVNLIVVLVQLAVPAGHQSSSISTWPPARRQSKYPLCPISVLHLGDCQSDPRPRPGPLRSPPDRLRRSASRTDRTDRRPG